MSIEGRLRVKTVGPLEDMMSVADSEDSNSKRAHVEWTAVTAASAERHIRDLALLIRSHA